MKCEKIHYGENSLAIVNAYNLKQMQPHWHDTDLEIVFVLEGKISVSAVYDIFEVNAGEFVVVNPEDIHLLQGYGDNVTFLIHIDLNRFTEKYEHILFIDLLCESFNTNSGQAGYAGQLRKLFARMILEAVKEKRNSSDKLNGNAAEAIEIMVNHFDIANYCNDKVIHENQLQRYYRIMKSISLNYDEKISMETISQEEYIGKNYMSQFWKKMIGINFTDYLNSRRTEMVQKLLLTTDLSLQEISLRCGFSDTKYLYKNFKKWYRSTPYEHKKKYQSLAAKIGDDFERFPAEQVAERFGPQLINLLVEEDYEIIEASKTITNWRQEFEKVVSFTNRRIKHEIMKENQKTLGISEIFLPLFDKQVVQSVGDDFILDWNFIGEVIKYAKEMNYIICIDMDYPERTPKEWYSIISRFTSFVLSAMGRECLSRFRFYLFVTEVYHDSEVEDLVNRLGEQIDIRNIKVCTRYR